MSPPRAAIITSYRKLYKAGLSAVQHSSPARFAVRDKIRTAFRLKSPSLSSSSSPSPSSHFSQERIDNTVEFLLTAARRKGIEHQVVRNLCLVHFWQNTVRMNRKIEGYETAYNSYYENIGLLNQSMEIELR